MSRGRQRADARRPAGGAPCGVAVVCAATVMAWPASGPVRTSALRPALRGADPPSAPLIGATPWSLHYWRMLSRPTWPRPTPSCSRQETGPLCGPTVVRAVATPPAPQVVHAWLGPSAAVEPAAAGRSAVHFRVGAVNTGRVDDGASGWTGNERCNDDGYCTGQVDTSSHDAFRSPAERPCSRWKDHCRPRLGGHSVEPGSRCQP